MKLPDNFWVRVLDGHTQHTWIGSPSEEKGFVVIHPPCEPSKRLGKLRFRIPADTKVIRRGSDHGMQYRFPILVGKDRLQGEIWWTVQQDQRLDMPPIELVSARMNRTRGGEIVVEVKLSYGYEDQHIFALRPHMAQRLLGMIHTSLHPEET